MVPTLIGLIAGLLGGLLGIGGGPVMIPLLVGFMALSQHKAHATSLAAIVVIATAGSIPFIVNGNADLSIAGLFAVGSLAGAPLGARTMANTREGPLKIAFGVFMIAVAVRLVVA